MKMRHYKVKDLELIANSFSWIRVVISLNFRKKHFLNYKDSSIDYVINEIEKTLNELKKLRVKGGE